MHQKSSLNLQIKELMQIPGVGKSIAADLINIGINEISDLKDRDPESLYKKSINLPVLPRIGACFMFSDARCIMPQTKRTLLRS